MNRSDNAVPQGEFEGGDAAATPDPRPVPAPGGEAQAAGAEGGPRAEGEGGEGGNERGDGERGERGRRRGRRDRRRGEAGEGGGDNRPRRAPMLPLPPNFEGPLPLHLQPVVPPEAGEVFAKVLAGEFDVEAEAPVETEEAASKRVLAAEPDAPKLHKVLAQAGIGSRRDMEDMIVEGRIKVNGEPAHTGQRISFGEGSRSTASRCGCGSFPRRRGSSRTTSRPARSSPTTIPSIGRPCSGACRACTRASGSR